jgi:hypothetical protein
MALNLKEQTLNQFLVRFRKLFRDSEKDKTCRLAHKVVKWIAAGDVTRANIKNAWNLADNAEYDIWLAKMVRLHNLWRDVQAEGREGGQ